MKEPCRFCNKSFNTAKSLQQHYATVHPQVNNVVMSRRKVVAPPRQFKLNPTIERPVGRNNTRLSYAQTVVPRSIANLNLSLGNTFEGALWARRALHPCDETTGGGVPIPDLSQTESANLESRHYNTITAELGGGKDWDCQFVVLPMVDSVCAYRQKTSDSAIWSYWHLVDLSKGVLKPGTITVKDKDWSIKNDGPEAQPTLLRSSTGFRQSFKGITIIHNSNALTNQGYVTAGQWGALAEEVSINMKFTTEQVDRTPTTCLVLKDIPDNPSEIVRNSPKSGSWEAKHGVYMPMRFNQPKHDYNKSTGNTAEYASTENDQLALFRYGYPVVIEGSADNISSDEFLFQNGLVWKGKPTLDPQSRVTDGVFYTSAGSINQNVGVIMFTGMSSTSHLEVKTRTGVELVPEPNNVMSAFIADAPLRDGAALDMVQAAQTKLQPVYEARYNSAGTIIVAIASAVAALAPIVMPFLRKKQPAPTPKYVEEPVD